MDLEKFFDKVNHDILVRKLEKRIKDQRLIKLIRKYLESGVLINGIRQMDKKKIKSMYVETMEKGKNKV